LSLAVLTIAVIAAGSGSPTVASAGETPQVATPRAAEVPAVHDHASHSHAAVSCEGKGQENAEGEYVPCTHGPDPAPPGKSIKVDVAAESPNARAAVGAVACEGDGVSGKRVEVLYVHGSTDRYAEYLTQFINWSVGMDTIYNESAKETGGERHLRFVTSGTGTCQPVIRNVAIPDSALGSFGASINAVRDAGYNRTDRKYVMFADANVYCGIGEFAGDDRKTDANRSNSGPSYGRTDSGCWDASTAAHELGHNLGAVNNSAPNTSQGGHCIDEYDVMCYSDSPNFPDMVIACADRAHDARLDCNHDDYYSTNPPAGSYLATHYNVADNPFLIQGGGTTPPPPPPPNPADFTLVQTSSAKCLDLRFGKSINNNMIQLWDCHNDGMRHNNQRIAEVAGMLQVSGKCLDVWGHRQTDGSKVVLWECHGLANQTWTVKTDGTIVSNESGKCLSSANESTASGTRAVIDTCDGGEAQKWTKRA
jgi:hypothetical protein